MISTETNTEYLKELEEFEKYKATLRQEPDGDVKKRYVVGCYNESDWEDIHKELMKDGSLEDNIPSDSIDCINDHIHNPTRGTYLLTPSEVADLEKHPKVEYVVVDTEYYKGTYEIFAGDLIADSKSPTSKTFRYTNSEKCYRNFESVMPNTATAAEINRSGYQIRRCMQKEDPWYGSSDSTIINDRSQYYGDGTDVDVVVCDTQGWFGHPEFNNNTGNGPTSYTGGNALDSNFSTYSATGYCDILDMVLDAPYYIDPDWFEANGGPSNSNSRLMTRWDGTVVPKESDARNWWQNQNLRSAKFRSGGSHAFSAISISGGTSYSRANCNGSNTARVYLPNGSTSHGSKCMGCTYGKTQGWAFNANKWFINNIGNYSAGIASTWEIQQIFHRHKPLRSSDGTKNPTVSSNSWGYRAGKELNGYWWYRPGTSNAENGSWTIGNTTSTHRFSPSFSSNTMPKFMRHMGWYGDATWNGSYYIPRFKGEQVPSTLTTALDNCINEGVIVVVAAGNSSQKQVKIDHPDYNNYWSTSSTGTISDTHSAFGYNHYNTINRPGYPQQGGKNASAGITNRIINVGALDDELTAAGGSTSGQERMVNYSDRGNAIDCYAPADDTVAATSAESGEADYPETYSQYDTDNLGAPQDDDFGGTSAACPVAAGLIATKMQYERHWSVENVKNWLGSLDLADGTKFFVGTESIGANHDDWDDENKPEDTRPTVIYDERTNSQPSEIIAFIIDGPLILSGSLNITA